VSGRFRFADKKADLFKGQKQRTPEEEFCCLRRGVIFCTFGARHARSPFMSVVDDEEAVAEPSQSQSFANDEEACESKKRFSIFLVWVSIKFSDSK
jgi:hypothetical protein